MIQLKFILNKLITLTILESTKQNSLDSLNPRLDKDYSKRSVVPLLVIFILCLKIRCLRLVVNLKMIS